MDLTPPGLDSDTHHTTTIPFSHSAASTASAPTQPYGQSMQQQHASSSSSSSSTHPKLSNGPHIRSRITVVCAECKRLKLKCDRRTPCSSCIKRDTVPRCVYTQAAAEKIDVQSLHNRLLVLESFYTKLSEAPPSTTLSSVLSALPPFRAPYPSSSSSGTLPGSNSLASDLRASGSTSHAQGTLYAQPNNNRALLAVGTPGSSVVVSMEDFVSIWLDELEEFSFVASDSGENPVGSLGSAGVKLEATPVLLPPVSSSVFLSSRTAGSRGAHPTMFVPPVPYETFLPSSSTPSTHVSTPANPYPPTTPKANMAEPPQVTPALLARLPGAERRAKYAKALEETMLLHPCFNVRHFVQRVEAMFVWGESGATASGFGLASVGGPARLSGKAALAHEVFFGAPPGKQAKPGGREQARVGGGPGSSPKPTLSFFAAACAALALGALVCKSNASGSGSGSGAATATGASGPSSDTRSAPSSSSSPVDGAEGDQESAVALLALSEQAIGLFEKTALYDLDAVIAMILQILYHLHDGQMSVAQGVFPLVGKMINVARMMGLAIDPDEFPGTYTLFEAETRRRIWWDVFYYDLFISDCMGHPPLIPDNSFTTRMPADVDEEQFSPSSTSLPAAPTEEGVERGTAYFALKCRLAQLVKNVKKQTFRDPLAEDPSELSIDQAAAFEAEISGFLADLPPAFRLELDREWSDPVLPPPSVPPFLQAQKCELAILGNRLILKLYLPFLKDSGNVGLGRPAHHQAVLGTINAAHLIIYASRMLHAVWRHTRPAAFDFYDFGRTLFDAAVVCAHAVIHQPTTLLAGQAMKGVTSALEVMRELGASRVGVEGVRGEGHRSEAIRIVEMMKRKAEAARSSNGGAGAGTKRKRTPLDDDRMSAGFHLPFVGASVASVKTDPARTAASPSKAASGLAKESSLGLDPKAKRKEREREKEKEKGPRHAPVGIRARPTAGPPTSRQRTGSVSSTAPAPPSGRRIDTSTPGAGPSTSHVQAMPPHPVPPPQPLTPRLTVPDSPRFIGYDAHSSRPPHTPVHEHLQHDDFPMHYGSSDDSNMVDRRRFSSQSFADSPQATSLFDQASHPSPASYSTGPTPPNYYAPYAPPPGPPSGYDNAPMGPPQSMPPMAGLTPPASMGMDSSGGVGMSMSTMTEQQFISYDKPPPPTYTGRPPEHARPLPHEYHPPPLSHSMPMSGSHPWLPQDPNPGGEMWNEYNSTWDRPNVVP